MNNKNSNLREDLSYVQEILIKNEMARQKGKRPLLSEDKEKYYKNCFQLECERYRTQMVLDKYVDHGNLLDEVEKEIKENYFMAIENVTPYMSWWA